ncbi:hypothetical protein LPW11_18285 [Geomonas sp. RF6]|uniref:hypothetical protein n=1 Tax=Geomonas sp. RF6 TaxID=2897342 RepID=UPI001E424B46|nr:hypothetical protein [Geomonas sp. RF6]UFS69825.1 hypothetical protein LPW11_18285 [Geomonas sp. RF6]
MKTSDLTVMLCAVALVGAGGTVLGTPVQLLSGSYFKAGAGIQSTGGYEESRRWIPDFEDEYFDVASIRNGPQQSQTSLTIDDGDRYQIHFQTRHSYERGGFSDSILDLLLLVNEKTTFSVTGSFVPGGTVTWYGNTFAITDSATREEVVGNTLEPGRYLLSFHDYITYNENALSSNGSGVVQVPAHGNSTGDYTVTFTPATPPTPGRDPTKILILGLCVAGGTVAGLLWKRRSPTQ